MPRVLFVSWRRLTMLSALLALALASAAAPAAHAGRYSDAVLADEPVGYWPLDETSPAQPAADLSGNSRHGTYSGVIGFGEVGVLRGGAGLKFSGNGKVGRVSVPRMPRPYLLSGAGLTLEAWVRAYSNAYPTPAGKFVKQEYGPAFGLWYPWIGNDLNPPLPLAAGINDPLVSPPLAPMAYGWHHVVFTADNGTGVQKLWLDGQEVATGMLRAATDLYQEERLAFGSALTLGGEPNTYETFAGGLDEVAEYSRALTAAEVAEHYALGARDGHGAAPERALLTSPVPGVGTGPDVTFSWRPAKRADSYRLVVDGLVARDGLTGTQVTLTGLAPGKHTWTIHAVNELGAGPTEAPRAFTVSASAAEMRALGLRFMPQLRFDTDEPWRPITAESYLSDTHVCASPGKGCAPLAGPDALAGSWSASAVLTAGGLAPGSALEWTRYPQRDDDPAVYYHVVSDEDYHYVDYWTLYRFNHFNRYNLAEDPELAKALGAYGEHEADWEGVTVAVPKRDPSAFDWVSFAAHDGSPFRYLPGVALCAGDAPCGPDKAQRAQVFVAQGAHGAYPRPCDGGGVDGCLQNQLLNDQKPWMENIPTEVHMPEMRHDGRRSWPDGEMPGTLKEFPAAARSWLIWPGMWDADRHVRSPANQARYRQPWAFCPSRKYLGDGGNGRCQDAPVVAASARADAPCAGWDGVAVNAMVCDAEAVRAALDAGTLGERPTLSLTGKPLAAAASARGLAQAIGKPLAPGQTVTVNGRASDDTVLVVRAQSGQETATATFTDLGLARGGAATVRVTAAGGRLAVTLRQPSGKTVRPQQLASVPRRPAKPRAVRATRRGEGVTVTFRAPSPVTVAAYAQRRGGKPLASRASAGRAARRAVRLSAGRKARWVRVAAVGATGPGRPVVVRVR